MGTGEQGVPSGFLHTASQSEAIIWGHMTCTWVFHHVMLEHPKWWGCQHINLEVGSQVYQLLKGFKQLQKATPWPDTTSSLYMGGF